MDSPAWNTMDPASQVTVCMKMLYNRQLTTTSGGNVSVRDDTNTLWVTPSGIDKCNVKKEQVCSILPDETVIGSYKPTSEWKMHFEILSYKCRDEIGAIVHTHSPTLLSFAISHRLPYVAMIDNAFAILGEVAQVPYCICGGSKLAHACAEVVTTNPQANCFLLQNHGVVVVGKTIEEAFSRLELLERIAQISIEVSSAVLSREEVFLLDNCDAFSRTLPRDEMDYRELDTFAKRAYNQKLIVCEHTFSKRCSSDSSMVCMNPHNRSPLFVTVCSYRSIALDSPCSSLHLALYRRFDSIQCILECLPPYTTILLQQQKCIDVELMPESYVVIGKTAFIRHSASLVEDVVSYYAQGYSVFLIERIGVLVTGTSVMQAFDRLEVLEATCEAVYHCQKSGQKIFKLTKEEVIEVDHQFGCGLIPQSVCLV